MRHSIADIATALGFEALGDTSIEITGASEPADAGPEDLALAMKPAFAEGLAKGRARAALVWAGADWQALGLQAAIEVPRPRMAMAGLTKMLDRGPGYGTGIHPTALIEEGAEVAPDATIGAFCTISAGAKIGAGCVLGPHVHVGPDSTLGEGCILHVRATVGPRVTIGARCILHPGATIGADGFSFVTPERNAVENVRESLGDAGDAVKSNDWVRIHSLGAVVMGDDCELGTNATIDAGTIRPTRIGNNVKIDNLCMIGHNCVVGDNTLMAALCGVAGSTTIGRNVIMGGQCGVSDNIFVGDNVVAAGGTKMTTKVPAGRVVMGYPAVKMETHLESYKAIRRLPRLFNEVAELKKAVFNTTPKS